MKAPIDGKRASMRKILLSRSKYFNKNQANFQGLVFYFSSRLICGKLHLNIAAKMRNKNITDAPTPIATKSPNGHNPAQTNASSKLGTSPATSAAGNDKTPPGVAES